MNQRKFIVLFLFAFSVAGTSSKISSENIRLNRKWKVRKSDGPEISKVKTFVPTDRKIKINSVNILKKETSRSKRSVDIPLRTNIANHIASNNSYEENSQDNKQLQFEDSDIQNSLWEFRLNVSSYKNISPILNNSPLDIAHDPKVTNDENQLDMSIYVSGKGPKLYNAWSSVEDLIKSMFGNVGQNSISENRVVLDIKGKKSNSTPANVEINETLNILPIESPGVFQITTETPNTKGKEGKFLNLISFGRRSTPPTSLGTSSHVPNTEVSTKHHSLNKEPSSETTTESLIFSNVITTTDHPGVELVIEEVINKNSFQSLPHISESTLAEDHSFTVESTISDELKNRITKQILHFQTKQAEGAEHECVDCEPNFIATTVEADFVETDVPQVSTIHTTMALGNSERSTFTNVELEKYCMALVNRLGKALKISDSLADDFGSGNSEIRKENTENPVVFNIVSNHTSSPTRSQSFGFFANLIGAITGRFRSETINENLSLDETGPEPETSIKDQSTRFGFLSFRSSRADNLDFFQGFSAVDENVNTNEDTKNWPSILDCENFFRNNENTKMFPKPNLMDALNDPHIRLEDFENATISPKLKEQQMQFLTDLLKTGMDQTSDPHISTESRDSLLESSTAAALTEESSSKEMVLEQFSEFNTKIENQNRFVTDRHVPKDLSENRTRQDDFNSTLSKGIINEETTKSLENSARFFSSFFGSGERSLDTTIAPQERFLSLFGVGSGDGRINAGDDQNELEKFETENLLREFENGHSDDTESTTLLKNNLKNNIISFEDRILDMELSGNTQQDDIFEGSGIARDFLLTTEYFSLDNECDGCSSDNINSTLLVFCKECSNKSETTNITSIPKCEPYCANSGNETLNVLNPSYNCEDDCENVRNISTDVDCEDDCENVRNISTDVDCEDDCDYEVKKMNVDGCKNGCASELKLNVTTFDCDVDCAGGAADVTAIDLDCGEDCDDGSENADENSVDSLDVQISEIDALNERLNESKSNKSSQIPKHLKTIASSLEVDRTVSTIFPEDGEPYTTEKKSRIFGTIFLTGSGADGLIDGEGQINLVEEEERISVPPVPRRGARLDDALFEKDDLSKFETKDETTIKLAQYPSKDTYDLTTILSTRSLEVSPRLPERRGRLDDENENPMEETFTKISKVTADDKNIISSQRYTDFNEPGTRFITDNLPESSTTSTSKSFLPRPTQSHNKPCISASECSQTLNERCLLLKSSSICTCGRSFIRHRETGICEAKVELKTALKLPREIFHEDLRNPDTELYKVMKEKAEETLWMLLSDDADLLNNIADIQVDGFSAGSIVINYKVTLATDKNESVSDLVDQVNSDLNEAFQNEGLMKSIPLDVHNATLLNISNSINPCSSHELNYCSKNSFCEQDDSSVGGFYCRCKKGYEDLSKNKKYAGEICEASCLPNYCTEHGVCQMDAIVGRHCSCTGWYFGDRCQISGMLIIAGVSAANVLLVCIVVTLLLCLRKRRKGSSSYGDARRRYPANLELGSSTNISSSKIADVIALEDNVGVKAGKITAISTPVQQPPLPTINIINATINDSSMSDIFDSTFDNTPSPLYENYKADSQVAPPF